MPAKRKTKKRWIDKLPDRQQAERLAHKEAAKQREVVAVVIRLIAPHAEPRKVKGGLSLGVAVELEAHCTRAELAALQAAHAVDSLWINYVKEPGR